MANEGSSVCCVVIFLIVANCFFWGRFSSEIEFFQEQIPGKCLDGRMFAEPVSAITGMGVDDTKKNKGTITMQCVFRVAYYKCSGVDDYTDYDGSCDSVAAEPIIADRNEWPLRNAGEPDVKCSTHGSEDCHDKDWDCSDIGKCNGYEKAVRLCASKLKREPYPCYMVPDNLAAGVREEPSSWPVGWLIGGILSALVSLACCIGAIVVVSEEERFCQKMLVSCAMMVCVWGVIAGLIYAVRLIWGDTENKQHGVWETTMAALAASNPSLNATDVLETLATEEPVDSMPTWAVVLIVFGSIFGLGCLMLGCVACLYKCQRMGHRARERALFEGRQESKEDADSDETANVKLKVGTPVTLVDDWDAQTGVLKPGDVGMVAVVDEFFDERQVCFQGHYWSYPTKALKACDEEALNNSDAPAAQPSMHSLRSNDRSKTTSFTQDISRRELHRAVSSTPNLTKGHVIGHAVLHQVEGHQQFIKRATSKIDVVTGTKTSAPAVVIATVVDETFLPCTEDFKFQKEDTVMVSSNLELVKRQCDEGAVTWDDSKSAYLGKEGIVKGTDWIGPGIRVRFPDGHWWSFHPKSLLIKTVNLDAERKASLQSKNPAVATVVGAMPMV